MSHKKPTAAVVRRVLDAALKMNEEKQLPRHHWEWIAKWAAGVGDGFLPSGLPLIANGVKYRVVTSRYGGHVEAVD